MFRNIVYSVCCTLTLIGGMLTKSEIFGMEHITENRSMSLKSLPYVQVHFPAFLISLARYNPVSWPATLQVLIPELDMLQKCDETESALAADLMLIRIGGAGFETLMHFITSESYDTSSDKILRSIFFIGMKTLDSRGGHDKYQQLKHDLSQLIDTPLLKTEEYRQTRTLRTVTDMSNSILHLHEKSEQEDIQE